MKNKKVLIGYMYVIISGILFGSMPLMADFIYSEGVNSLSLVFWRNILSIPILGVLAYLQTGSLKINRKALPSIAAVGMSGCCITPFLLFSSYNYIASGTATVFHFIYPAMVVVGGFLIFRQKVSLGRLLSVLTCIAGILMFYDPSEPLDLTGSVLALLSGIAYTAYILLLSKFKYKEISGFLFSFYISLISTVALFIICIVTGELTLPQTLFGWGMCVLFALAVNVGAVVLFQRGTFYIDAQRAAILSTTEPITSIFLGALFLNETIGMRTAIGSFFVLMASVLIALFDIKQHQDKEAAEEAAQEKAQA